MSYDIETLRAREFPWATRGESVYLDHASTGPLPQRTRDVMADFGLRRAEPFRLTSDDLFPVFARARERAARLMNTKPACIALTTNTSHGVNIAARSLPFGAGDVILSTHGEFPANVYPWFAAAKARGAEFRLLPLAGDLPDEAAIMRAIEQDPHVKVVALSWVLVAAKIAATASCTWIGLIRIPVCPCRVTALPDRTLCTRRGISMPGF